MSADEAYAGLLEALTADDPDTEVGRAFSSEGLKVGGKLFAFLVRGGLGIKLPAERCAELVAAGVATPMQTGTNRPMREWVRVEPEQTGRWRALAEEAREFVRP
jgi:hypothetical protein